MLTPLAGTAVFCLPASWQWWWGWRWEWAGAGQWSMKANVGREKSTWQGVYSACSHTWHQSSSARGFCFLPTHHDPTTCCLQGGRQRMLLMVFTLVSQSSSTFPLLLWHLQDCIHRKRPASPGQYHLFDDIVYHRSIIFFTVPITIWSCYVCVYLFLFLPAATWTSAPWREELVPFPAVSAALGTVHGGDAQ